MAGDSRLYEVLDQILEEFAARYRRGERPAIQEFIDRHPDLADDIRAMLPAMVEIERYNRKPPEKIPADEFVTRAVKTDPAGVVTTTLPEAGWWGLTVDRPGRAVIKSSDKQITVKERCTLWVRVGRPESK